MQANWSQDCPSTVDKHCGSQITALMVCWGAVRSQWLQSSAPSTSQPPLQQPHLPAAASRGHVVSRRPQRRGVAWSSGSGSNGSGAFEGLPADNAAVADWAARGFREAAQTSLTRACLFLALEEEAAAQAACAEAEQLSVGADGIELRGCAVRRRLWPAPACAAYAAWPAWPVHCAPNQPSPGGNDTACYQLSSYLVQHPA
jgi:hypothetical protein